MGWGVHIFLQFTKKDIKLRKEMYTEHTFSLGVEIDRYVDGLIAQLERERIISLTSTLVAFRQLFFSGIVMCVKCFLQKKNKEMKKKPLL